MMMWMLLVVLLGWCFGVLLGFVASEELELVRRYFVWLCQVLFFGMVALLSYILFLEQMWFLFWLFLFGGGIFFSMEYVVKKNQGIWQRVLIDVVRYGFGAGGFLVLVNFARQGVDAQLLLIVLLFLYGLPAGSLWKELYFKHEFKNMNKIGDTSKSP